MLRNRLTLLLLFAATALLLAACTTPTDGLLATQGFGHFNAKSVTIDSSGGSFGLRTQSHDGTGPVPIQANGFAAGVGADEYKVNLIATGDPLITCTNQGGNEAPGQNPAISTLTSADIPDSGNGDKNGKFEFFVNNDSAVSSITFATFPCANENWEAHLDFIFWTNVELQLEEIATGITDKLFYECVTQREPEFSIDCSLVKNQK